MALSKRPLSIVHEALPIFYVLRHCSSCTYNRILKDKALSFILQAIRELAYNYLFGDLPLTKKQKVSPGKEQRLLKRLVQEKKAATLRVIILKNRKALVDIILEPVESYDLKQLLQQQQQ